MDLAGAGRRNDQDLADARYRQSPTRSCATQGRIYAGIGDVVTVIEALGIDPKQYFDTVPGALGYPRRGHPRT
jgi:hypothetical protein